VRSSTIFCNRRASPARWLSARRCAVTSWALPRMRPSVAEERALHSSHTSAPSSVRKRLRAVTLALEPSASERMAAAAASRSPKWMNSVSGLPHIASLGCPRQRRQAGLTFSSRPVASAVQSSSSDSSK